MRVDGVIERERDNTHTHSLKYIYIHLQIHIHTQYIYVYIHKPMLYSIVSLNRTESYIHMIDNMYEYMYVCMCMYIHILILIHYLRNHRNMFAQALL